LAPFARVVGHDRFVARAEIGVGEQVQQFVGAGAADDAIRIEAEALADRLTQNARRAFRVVLKMRRAVLVRGDRLRRRAEWGLVGGQLVDFGNAGSLALARGIGGNIENARTRHRTGHGLKLRTWS
jgi:hypothetical protein